MRCSNRCFGLEKCARCGTDPIAPGTAFWTRPDIQQALHTYNWSTLLAALKNETRASQAYLAETIGISQAHFSRLVTGRVTDPAFSTGMAILTSFGAPLPSAGYSGLRHAGPGAGPLSLGDPVLAFSPWPGASLLPTSPALNADWYLQVPGGWGMPGTQIAVQHHRLRPAGSTRGELHPSQLERLSRFAAQNMRTLVLGSVDGEQSTEVVAADARSLVGRASRATIPTAYRLDDVTFAAVWAVANLDDALLSDDAALTDSIHKFRRYHELGSSSVDGRAAADLTAVSRGWLGSQFCAHHILRHLDATEGDASVFWSREQTGEEAANWLLFRHKYHYLQNTRPASASTRTRVFCFPETRAVRAPTHERILLFLAVALMESVGIAALVTPLPEFADIDGFVLGEHRATIATWVRAEGVWHVDTLDRRTTLRDFEDIHQAARGSALGGHTAPARLMLLAGYLNLDLPWLARRCAEITQAGWEGVARPRSSLLALDGLSAASAYVACLPDRLRTPA